MKPLTREFLISRGRCCGNKCLNCPYEERWVAGSTKIKMNDLTVSLLIGNSDNKLSQEEYYQLIKETDYIINEYPTHVFFTGGSNYDSPYQNACWVFEINKDELENMKKELKVLRQLYRQDAVALIIGHTHMV